MKRAHELGVKTSLDHRLGFHWQWLSTIEPALSHLDYLVPSLEEASHIAGRDDPEDVADFFLGYGIEIVALKMGAKG